MIRLDDLLIENYKIFQDDSLYTFTSDSVLLAKFAKVKKDDIVADLCSGSGIVGLHLYCQNKNLIKSLHLFELQKALCDLSVKSIEYNGFNSCVFAHNENILDIDKSYNGSFSLITCNPPYMEKGRGEVCRTDSIAICKTEIEINLKQIVETAGRLLNYGGRFCIVHRADRLVETICLMKNNNLEPKRLQFVCAKNKKPYLFLTESVKYGKKGLNILNNITN